MTAMRDSDGKMIEINVPLEQWVRDIAEHAAAKAAKEVVKETRENCPAIAKMKQVEENTKKIDNVRVMLGTLIGYMIGSGTVSGLLVKFLF